MTSKIGVVIVTYKNSEREISDALHSVALNHIEECVVIDNGPQSFQAETEEIVGKYDYQYIKRPDNLGFAAGADHGIKHSKSQYMLLLNPDAKIKGNNLPLAVQFLDQHTRIGALGLRLASSENIIEPDSFGRLPTLATLFTRRLFKKPILKDATLVGWVSGGSTGIQDSLDQYTRAGRLSDWPSDASYRGPI